MRRRTVLAVVPSLFAGCASSYGSTADGSTTANVIRTYLSLVTPDEATRYGFGDFTFELSVEEP